MIAKLEADSRRPSVVSTQEPSSPDTYRTDCTSGGKFRGWDATDSVPRMHDTIDGPLASKSVAISSQGIPRTHDTISITQGYERCFLESDLRIALTTLIELESAEPFLCDHSEHGLLGLNTIQQRLDEGKYVDVKLFWSDIDECLSVCASAGRHPFMVWDMRACFQQLEEDFWVASKSVATSLSGIPRTHDTSSINQGYGTCFLESDLRIALTALIGSESAEPFLCDHSEHGLLGLNTIQQRLDKGKYEDVKLFESDIDECLSVCASAGRHPFMVWDMRACFQQMEEDFWAASKSVATSSRGIPNNA